MQHRLIKSGRWSDVFFIHDCDMGARARKYLHYATKDQAYREWRCASDAWNCGLPVPEPLNICYCSETKRFYIDYRYLLFREFEYKDLENFVDNVIYLANQIESLDWNGLDRIRWWEIYFSDLMIAFDYCINMAGLCKKDQIFLSYSRECLNNLKYSNFIHGDFAIQNMGILGDKIFIYDLQWGGAGPKSWDKGYFFSQHPPRFAEKFFDRNKEIPLISVSCAAIKVGRCIIGNRNLGNIKTRLHEWIEIARDRL